MQHKALALWKVLVVVAIGAMGAAILFPPHHHNREGARRAHCQSNLKQTGLAFAQYTADYDDKFPPLTSVAGFGSAALARYIGENNVFQCPSVRTGVAGSTDYFYNARLAKADKTQFAPSKTNVSATILGGEGAENQGASYHLWQLPDSWRKDESSPAWRHLEGANYLFADGHVKWFRAERIFADNPASGHPTFLVK